MATRGAGCSRTLAGARPPLRRALSTGGLRRLLLTLGVVLAGGLRQEAPPAASLGEDAPALLERLCASCHFGPRVKGGVQLEDLAGAVGAERTALLRLVGEVLELREMPPADEAQPTDSERALILGWVSEQLGEDSEAAALADKLRYPQYGNLVDHEALFSSGDGPPASTPARRWLVSPQLFHERVMEVFGLEGRDRSDRQHRAFDGVTNPFLLSDHSGVRDYDTGALDGGDLLVMLGNARWIADRQILMTRRQAGETVEFPNPKDRWMPRAIPEGYRAFAPLLEQGLSAASAPVEAAVREQFLRVLQREPTAEELERYGELTREAIELGGGPQGLRQLLVAVLLESEFVYRLEFGEGPADEHGRRLLAPREAAYALSYALGDRRPDAALLEAADQGRLRSTEDYAREARRLLADPAYYRGQIDPALNGKHFRSNETSHPRLVRFFREFFGYPAATKVFKDPPRSGGIYQNPGRGTTATPGRLILETDRLVTRILEQDEDVFRRLLTSDEFFVYHDRDNEEGQRIQGEWRAVHERLRGTAWRTEPERVLEEHLEFLKGFPSLRIQDTSRPGELVNLLHFFEDSFGQGRAPFTTVPWAHGYTFHHSPLYNLPPTPGIYRYGSWKSTEYRGDKVEPREFWDYPAEQPFRIEHRMGLLTHPSWLIAHSTNFQPDPVRRGRWIREKLLAGRVPDIPITVDATVPDDPEHTFRQRLVAVTEAPECWSCHQFMNPLGLPFQAFDDFGRYRLEEVLEHPDNLLERGNGKTTFDVYPTAPISTTGALEGTGDPTLDGQVADPFDLIERLAASDRVRQSMIRYAFRFFMGRNETLADARTLQAADQAYTQSGGSFRALVVSLLSSDSFRYRRDPGQ